MKWLAAALVFLLAACTSQPQRSPDNLASPPPGGEPSDLFGLTSNQLRGSFGAPSFSRRENGSELWRYDNAQCRVFFFLYPAGNAMSVRHVETAPHGRTAADPACLAALRAKG
jgi:hypothetical protein